MNLTDLPVALAATPAWRDNVPGDHLFGTDHEATLSVPSQLKPCFYAALATAGPRPLLIIAPGPEDAADIARDLEAFSVVKPLVLPARSDSRSAEAAIDPEAAGRRAKSLPALAAGETTIIVTHAAVTLEALPPLETAGQRLLRLVRNQDIGLDALIETLVEFGYRRVYEVEDRGEFSVRGGIIDVFGPGMSEPVRAVFDADTIEEMRTFGLVDQLSTGNIEATFLYPVVEAAPPAGDVNIFDYARGRAVVAADEPAAWPEGMFAPGTLTVSSLTPQESPWRVTPHPTFTGADGRVDFDLIKDYLTELAAADMQVLIAVEGRGRRERLSELLREWGAAGPSVDVVEGFVRAGFSVPALGIAVIAEADMFGLKRELRQTRQSRTRSFFDMMDLRVGDLVVHIYHGIGRYGGLVQKDVDGIRRDFLVIEYAGGDKLFIPSDQIGLIQRYIGGEGVSPKIDRLGAKRWQNAKRKVKASAAKLAVELVRLYQARQAAVGHAFPPDTPWQKELEDSFPFIETPDQAAAIADVKRDMESTRPMDRLICGDVGYGKTEVAVRAVFKAVLDGRQAAVLVPTTLLAEQHASTLRERFKEFPVRVEVLSRLHGGAAQNEVLHGVAAGTVDVVIGTHRLLQKDVSFKDLGLFVIDEEQRFGVRHKEFLKKLRLNVDVLTLSATPIPRTLNLALTGARDMSVIETAPEDRFPVVTAVKEYADDLVARAIEREVGRGGQVFFVHNRVDSIDFIAERIRRLAPGVTVGVSHGQMSERGLEKVMKDFAERRFAVLVSTTIIESGLDMPNVNTLIVDRADRLGLSQLYQLRGRVGRSDRRAYAMFLYPPGGSLSPTQLRRLKTIAEFTELGSGFRIALRDLEIRGAGNLLGGEQHGFINEVGFELYAGLLAEAVAELKGEPSVKRADVRINLPIAAFIPDEYVADEGPRIDMYRKVAQVRRAEDADRLGAEFNDRFGPPPLEVKTLLAVAKLKVLATAAGLNRITAEPSRVRLSPLADSFGVGAAVNEFGRRIRYKAAEKALFVHMPATDGIVSLLHEVLYVIITNDLKKSPKEESDES